MLDCWKNIFCTLLQLIWVSSFQLYLFLHLFEKYFEVSVNGN